MKASPAIYTLTGNLLAERTLEFETWQIGHTQRATRESFNTRGKGVNVTNMLARLGTASTALIFAGGSSGAECEAWLRLRGLPYRAFPTAAASRTGTVIWSGQVAETTFLGPDAAPDAGAVQACAAFLNALPSGKNLALCGSFPGWNESCFDVLKDALHRWMTRGLLFADVYGPPLHWLVEHPVELIKINRDEFDSFLPPGKSDHPLNERMELAREKFAVKNWVISNGADSVTVLARDDDPIELFPPAIREISATGSGDVLFAAILHALTVNQLPLADAVKFALPYASANAAHTGVADFDLPMAT